MSAFEAKMLRTVMRLDAHDSGATSQLVAEALGASIDEVEEVFAKFDGELSRGGYAVWRDRGDSAYYVASPSLLRATIAKLEGKTPAETRSQAIRNTTEITRQLRYTAEEAAQAHAKIEARVTAGQMTRRSGAAFKAHVSRRVVVEA